MSDKVRINKYIASCGVCSRRDADKLIESGKVTVNGVVPSPGLSVDGSEDIVVNGKPLNGPNKKTVLAFYKPVGITCTERDPYAEKTINDIVKYSVRVTYAGRLDKDSEGLLLLTNDGELIDKMMRGSAGHEKEYIVRINKPVNDSLIERFQKGIYIKDLDRTTKPCFAEKISDYTFRVILTEGLNRQIRRMCEICGSKVTSLKRIRVVNVELGKLKSGEFRELTADEIERLYSSLNR